MTKPKAPKDAVGGNIKARQSSSKRSPKNLNEMPIDEFSEYLFKKLESDDDLIPADFSKQVDQAFLRDVARRVALIFLSKPWKEMTDAMVNDRETAVQFAQIALSLDQSIDRYKALADLLGTAQTRNKYLPVQPRGYAGGTGGGQGQSQTKRGGQQPWLSPRHKRKAKKEITRQMTTETSAACANSPAKSPASRRCCR